MYFFHTINSERNASYKVITKGSKNIKKKNNKNKEGKKRDRITNCHLQINMFAIFFISLWLFQFTALFGNNKKVNKQVCSKEKREQTNKYPRICTH